MLVIRLDVTMDGVILRGKTYYARYRVPEARWADVGRALGSSKGLRREVVKTLSTSDAKEARQRRHEALSAIQAELDRALRKIGRPPLTDWTSDWLQRAVSHRASLADRGEEVVGFVPPAAGDEPAEPITYAELTREEIDREAEQVEARRGAEAAAQFRAVALGDSLSIAEALRRWLPTLADRRVSTVKGHEAAFRKLEGYLGRQKGWKTLEGVGLHQINPRIAGEFIAECCHRISPAAVKREASAFNGLWKWARRRGYVENNPWNDQTTGLIDYRTDTGGVKETKRGYTAAEVVSLLRAGAEELAPNGGGYAAAFYDTIRLLLLTGARPDEVLNLRVADVIAEGKAIALAASRRGGKTKNASRIIPLHARAADVIRRRLETLQDRTPDAPLFAEVPAQGGDKRRSKTIATRYVAVRRRILPDAEDVDLYSLRRFFLTAAETAKNNSERRLDAGIIARLAGQKQGHLALDLYSDWNRLGRPALAGELAAKLRTLSNAVDLIVSTGFPEEVREALAETAGDRPAMVRTAPAFLRRSK